MPPGGAARRRDRPSRGPSRPERDDIAQRVAELDESDLEDAAAGATVRKTGIRVSGISSEPRDATYGKWIDILAWSGGYDWHE